MSHFMDVCQYGHIHRQCRCPDPNKTVNQVPCPDPVAEKPEKDKINPDHYKSSKSGVECIEVTEQMGFCIGNAVKYLWRLGQKDDNPTELGKVRWYLDRQIDLDGRRGLWFHIQDWPEWNRKFTAHIKTMPPSPARGCMEYIQLYHTEDAYTNNLDRRRYLQYALKAVETAIAEQTGFEPAEV